MKGLLLKDWLTIKRETKYFFVFIIVFMLIPVMLTAHYSIFFASVLPVNACGYDDRCKWDKLARMMPYSSRDMVASKYVLGYLLVGVIALFDLLIQGAYSVLNISWISLGECFINLVAAVCIALIYMALELPLIFWLGTEKCRIFSLLFTVGLVSVMGSMATVSSLDGGVVGRFLDLPAVLFIVGVTLVLQIVSLKVSEKLYQFSKRR